MDEGTSIPLGSHHEDRQYWSFGRLEGQEIDSKCVGDDPIPILIMHIGALFPNDID
jgi:hypothetical protein